MKTTKLRQIGGSKGVLLNKSVLDEVEMNGAEEFEIEAVNGKIVLSPHKNPLDEFALFFKQNPGFEGDDLVFDHRENESDEDEWKW